MSKKSNTPNCPVANTLDVFAGKWKPEILWQLSQTERMRFNELQRAIEGVSAKMLAQQLQELQRDGLVNRIQLNNIPPHVEYEATPMIQTLEPLFDILEQWYVDNGAAVQKANKKYDKENPS
ncbi:MAG: helix-turn-helix domain-containing protein [Verrucomicrobiota bacterium]